MMVRNNFHFIGKGVYTLAEAARLARVPASSIRRWTSGYEYKLRGERRTSPPVVMSDRKGDSTSPVVTFADLIEVRFLHAFRKHGVDWKAIRIAAHRARELLGRHHPFSTRLFKTDGRTILTELYPAAKDPALLDLVRNQFEFDRIISPMLYEGLEFNQLDVPARWWPLGQDRHVVVDPLRGFGAPLIAEASVPTSILARAVAVEGSIKLVAAWYEVSEDAVRSAVQFEGSLAA